MPNWLSLKQAAAHTSLSVKYLRGAIRAGQLVAANVGSAGRPTYRISLTELEGFMRSREGRTGKPSLLPPSRHYGRGKG